MRRLLTPAMRAALLGAASRDFAVLGPSAIDRRTADGLARRGLMRVEWCAVLTADGARLAQSMGRPPGDASVDGDEAQGGGR